MIKTEHGVFAGDSWEEFCQLCFKLKYEAEGYQTIPAWQGDFGIEGFTRTGKVFQCYCPDFDYAPDKLYDEQRDKVTTDLLKLIANEKQLGKYLKKIKIKEWIFVTPMYKKKDLVRHCRDKADEYRLKNISILDNSFDVLIHDLGNFTAQIPIVKGYQQRKLDIIPSANATDEDVIDWKSQQISYVENALKKHEKRFGQTVKDKEVKINKLTNNSIADLLNGDRILRRWESDYPVDYEKFLRMISQYERRVEEKCFLAEISNNELYKEIASELKDKIKESFSMLDNVMIDRLCDYVLADWMTRCPINFE
jgi:hypothetical protein